MKEFFSVPKIEYEGPESKNVFAFKHYNPSKIICGKSLKEHLKFAMSWWHTLCAEGTDMFGSSTGNKTFGAETPMEQSKNKVLAGFEFMDKLGIEYFCFHDKDLAPEGESLSGFQENLDEIAELVKEQMQKYQIKSLWSTANLFNHPRYANGAGTACDADVYCYAAAQIKKALDLTMLFGGKGYVFWGGR